jgi:hypothetical protein
VTQVGTAFVGRDRELARLSGLLDDARLGLGGAAVLLGDPGIGKSSLADALARAALNAGCTVAWGRCPETDGPPYWPWRQVLAALDEGSGRTAFGHGSRTELFCAVLETLERRAATQPVVLILDDVHRADEASLELLGFVAGQLRGTRIVLVAAARNDPLELAGKAAATLAGLPSSVLRVDLGGLDLTSTGALVCGLAATDVPDVLVADIHRRTGGNPFFVSEVARLGVLRDRHTVEAAFDVPSAVQHVLSRRFARLEQQSVQLLEVASVVGTPDLPVLAAVAELAVDDVRALLDDAVRARLLVSAGVELRFAHDLVRETLYAGLGPVTRARLHRAVAKAAVDADPGELAQHWARASGSDAADRAAANALAAADAALARTAYEQAVRYYRWALDGGAGDRITVSRRLGEAQVLAGDVKAGRSMLRDTATNAIAEGRPDEAARAVLAMGSGLGGFEVDIADTTQVQLLEAALADLPPDDVRLRAGVLARLSIVRTRLSPVEDRAAQARAAVALAVQVGDPATEAAALAALSDALSGPDDVQLRREAADRMLTLADTVADASLALLALRMRLVAHLESGDLAGADVDIAEYAGRAERLRSPLYTWLVPVWRGMRAAMDGDLERAEQYAVEAETLGKQAGSANAEMMVWALRLALARANPAKPAFERLAHQAGRWQLPALQWNCSLAAIYAYTSRPDQARAHLLRVAPDGLADIPKDSEYLELNWQLAEAAILTGERAAASAIRDALAPYADVWAVDGIGGACFGPVSDLLQRLDRLLDGRRRAEPEPAEPAEFRHDGRVWHLDFRGRQGTVPHSKGMTDLATLLARPGREVHALDLVEAAGGPPRALAGADTGPVLDSTARTAYRQRLADLEQELDEADADSDQGRAAALTAERDFLLAELSAALGLGGRDRVTGDGAERARKAVTMRIGTAVRAIADVHPDLARHLRVGVSTGRFCRYQPERPVTWRT